MMRKVGFVIGVIMTVMLAVRPFWRQPAVHFRSLHEAARGIEKLNYTCCSDLSSGRIVSGFMVSKETATWKQANELCKSSAVSPKWRNKVWVMRLPTGMTEVPDGAGIRVWGRLFAYGDATFLDEIEDGLLAGSFSPE